MAAMSRISSFHILLFSILSTVTLGDGNTERDLLVLLRLSKHCRPLMVRLDQYDSVKLESNILNPPNITIPGNITCTAHFMTGNTEQGICITNNFLSFNNPMPGIQLKIFTSRFGPEKAFNYFHQKDFKTWCTKESIVSIELTSTHEFNNVDGDYILRFQLTNVSKDGINKHYRMDSFKHCNLSHILKQGDEIRIYDQEYPAPADLPSTCLLTFSTKSEEEYEEVCLHIEESRTYANCLSSLIVSGFNSRFWPKSEVLGCNDTHSELRTKKEMCSSDKTLTLNLTRLSTIESGQTFVAVVEIKRHPYWQVISQEKSELRGLDFVKGVTYFVAAIDSLAGIAAAILTHMFKRPRSFWKSWAESVKIPDKCEAVHYEDSCTAVSSSKIEDIMEVKSY